MTASDVRLELPEAATTVRIERGATLTTDGPSVAVKEALRGYVFYEAAIWTPRSTSPRGSRPPVQWTSTR